MHSVKKEEKKNECPLSVSFIIRIVTVMYIKMLQQLEHVTLLNPTCQNVQQPVCCPHSNEGIHHLVQSTAQICVPVWCNCCNNWIFHCSTFIKKKVPTLKVQMEIDTHSSYGNRNL